MNKIFYILFLTLIIANEPPEWIQTIDNQIIEEDCAPCTGFPIDLNLYISDPDDDPLSVTVSDVTGATFSINDDLLLDIEVDDNFNTDVSGPITLELTLSDGEFDVLTTFETTITSDNDIPVWLEEIPLQSV